MAATDALSADASLANGHESSYVKELQKNIRNISKKLASTHKTDAVIAENPNVSLDELVAQKKINQDQKAAALKKPQLQAQLQTLEEQVQHYRKFESDTQAQLAKQKEELEAKHTQEFAQLKEQGSKDALETGKSQLRSNLLVFSQFLRAAAAKRSEEDNVESEENKAFEGVLLLVYGGDQKAVDSAVKIIEGSEDKAPSIEGTATSISYAQIKQASIDHSPFQSEEAWVNSVAEAQANTVPAGSDPTLVNAGLTEQADVLTNGAVAQDEPVSQPVPTDAGNAAADRWDSNVTSTGAESAALEESYEVIPRPDEEVETPATSAVQTDPSAANVIKEPAPGTSWADEVPAYAAPPQAKPEGDGFQEVPGRTRGRGRGGHHRGDGEHRGRGRGRGRGDGEYRGRGRGRGDGEHRGGRGGRGRGRGDGGVPRGA